MAVVAVIVIANRRNYQLDSQSDPLVYGLQDSLNRIGWSIAISYIIFACMHGSGGPVNWFLSWPMWQPLAKLSYTIYMCQLFPTILVYKSSKIPLHFSEFENLQRFIGILISCIFIAIPMTLAFEMPIDNILKLTLFRNKK